MKWTKSLGVRDLMGSGPIVGAFLLICCSCSRISTPQSGPPMTLWEASRLLKATPPQTQAYLKNLESQTDTMEQGRLVSYALHLNSFHDNRETPLLRMTDLAVMSKRDDSLYWTLVLLLTPEDQQVRIPAAHVAWALPRALFWDGDQYDRRDIVFRYSHYLETLPAKERDRILLSIPCCAVMAIPHETAPQTWTSLGDDIAGLMLRLLWESDNPRAMWQGWARHHHDSAAYQYVTDALLMTGTLQYGTDPDAQDVHGPAMAGKFGSLKAKLSDSHELLSGTWIWNKKGLARAAVAYGIVEADRPSSAARRDE